MATKSVATTSGVKQDDPSIYGAKPHLGNYTDEAAQHLWCATALANVLASPETPIENFNGDIQAALRHLLRNEIERAHKAEEAQA